MAKAKRARPSRAKKTSGNNPDKSATNVASSPAVPVEQPLPADKQVESAQEERLRTTDQTMSADGTTPRHREPLGPPAPGQGGRPGPERRVVPGNTQGAAPVTEFNTDTPEGMAAYKQSLGARIRVRATKMGFIDNVRRRAGDVFDVREGEFSNRWMEVVDGSTPPKATTSKQALRAQNTDDLANRHREVATDKAAGRVPAPRSTGDREVGD